MAAKRGRQPGFTMSPEHRAKIANSQILKCLIEHAEGRRDMSATQVTSGLGLLKKVLPDLQSVEMSGGLAIESVTKERRDAAVAAATRANT